MRRIITFVTAGLALFAVGASPAYGDAVYHSQHIVLTAVGGAPLRTGFVENVHANGPLVYAHEIYVLNGAQPFATYQVTLNIFVGSPDCAGSPMSLPTATVATNAAGNGRSDARFSPADAGPLRHQTHGIIWTFSQGDAVAYSSGCMQVTLD